VRQIVRLGSIKSVISGFRLGHFGRRGGEEMMF